MLKQYSYKKCNSCSGNNKIEVKDTINQLVSECTTKCVDCGFKDYWSQGSFESSQEVLNVEISGVDE